LRAIQMTAPGGPEVLRFVELPEPEITGERDVKVRLRAAGINPADYKQRAEGWTADLGSLWFLPVFCRGWRTGIPDVPGLAG
jgi:NADPH:quinone reductase-like Zn-dependent oxidoreductase